MKQIAVALLIFSAVLLSGQPVPAQTIKLGTLAPKGSPYYDILRDLEESWKEESGGNIRFRIYPGGVVGDDPDMVRKMRIGQLDAALLSGSGLTEIAPEIKALQMPMMFESNEEWDYVRERLAPKLEQILEAKGFKTLLWGDAGWVYLFAQQPVVYPDDMRPLRLFVWAGDPGIVQVWRDQGYRPVPLAVNEIHSALHSGLINTFTTTPLAALSFQWFGLAKEMTDLKWSPLVGALVITNKKWRAIPAEIKPRLLESAREAGTRFLHEIRKHNDEALLIMRRHGLVVHHVPPDAKAQWKKSFRANYPMIMGDAVPPELVAEAERIRDKYRASGAGN